MVDFYQKFIPSLKVNEKPEAIGLCPFHDDHHPSLSVNVETGLYHCHACGAGGDVFNFYQMFKDTDFLTALREIGEMVVVVDTNVKPKIVATFKYYNSEGKLLYVKERLEPGRNGRNKEFVFKHLENGKWTLGRGCDPVLYSLLEVIKAKCCFVVEGEGKADLLNSWEIPATCLDSGANSPWRDAYLKAFEGKEKIVILPDNDSPGKQYALKIANTLHGKIKELKIVEIPGLGEAEDILNWTKIPGNDKEKLAELVKNTSEWMPSKGEAASLLLVNQPETDKAEVFNCTDLGNAKRLVSQNCDKIRYCFAWKKWLVWDGKTWSIDNNGQILRLAKDTIKLIYEEASLISDEARRKAIAKWAVSSESEHRLNAMVSLAQSEEGMPISPDQLDTKPHLLNCQNGTIDLKTGELKPHDKEYLITKMIPVYYRPEVICEMWLKFLERIFNFNYDIIQFLQRSIGYSLTGDTSEQCLFLLHGTGANGKSTFLNILNLLLGNFAQTASFETFLLKKQDRINNDIARMQGKRFISAIEAEGERRLSEVIVKQLTGGDTVTARFLFAEFFEFKPQFKIWLACNHKPIIRGTDHAIWRRIKLIPFNVTIPENERDKHLTEKLQAELPGILAWAVKGCLSWQKEGLKTPDEIKTATNEYQTEMDVIKAFLDECCFVKVDSPEVKIISGNLYDTYKSWCERNGVYAVDNRTFGKRLSEKGFIPKQSNGKRWWHGIGILDGN